MSEDALSKINDATSAFVASGFRPPQPAAASNTDTVTAAFQRAADETVMSHSPMPKPANQAPRE
jgi:hypothetical protein